MIRSPAGFDGADRIKRYLDYYQPSYGVMMLSAGQFSPALLFAQGEQGVWYDPSDFSTLFQDAAGTTPVTAVEQPVGLILDKSKGLVLGSELVDTANTAAAWTEFGNNTVEQDGDAVKVTFVDNANGAYMQLAAAGGLSSNLTQFKRYKIVFEARINTGSANITQNLGGAYASIGTSNSANYQTFTAYVSANGAVVTNYYMQFSGLGAGEIIYIRNISVRELPGNHASQSTSASRPVLSARVNLLTYTEEFDNAAWTLVNIAAFGSGSVANATTAPNGTATADLLVPNTVSSQHGIFQTAATVPSGVSCTAIWHVKPNGYTKLAIVENQVTGYYTSYDASGSGSVLDQSNATGTITALADGWYRVTHTSVSGGTSFRPQLFILPSTYTSGSVIGSWTPNGTSGIYIWGADLRPANAGVGLPAYQRVGAATSGSSTAAGNADYDTTGFPYYLKFDGTDDGMATAAIDFSGTDKVSVVAGVRKLSDAASAALVELSASSGSTLATFAMLAPKTAAQTGYSFRSQGGSFAQVDATSTNYAAPITTVLTGLGDIANDGNILRANGAQVASSSQDQGSGNYANQPLYIGSRAGSSLRFNGHIYGLVIVGRALTASEISSMETWMAAKTGVTI